MKERIVGECATTNRVRVLGVALKGCAAGRIGKETDVMEILVGPQGMSALKNQTVVRILPPYKKYLS